MKLTKKEVVILKVLSNKEAVSASSFKDSMSVSECRKIVASLRVKGFAEFVNLGFEDLNDFFFRRTPKCIRFLKENPIS